MRRLVVLPFVLVAGLVFSISVAVPASAHTSLVGIDPAEGSTVAPGDSVTLDFSEPLLTIGAEATVTDSAGVVTKLDVTFPKPTSAGVVLPSMAGGKLTLAWRVVAGDGHPVEGKLAYVADAGSTGATATASAASTPSASAVVGPAASAGATTAPSASATPIVATPTATPSAGGSRSSGFTNVALWAAIFAAILASSIAIIAAKRRR